MTSGEQFSITRTTDQEKIAACAKMMSETDPWLTYTMDYAYCLKAFEGDCKEVYILDDNKMIAGFAILQVCGSFKGYIQSLCVDEQYRGRGLGNKLLRFCEERILRISPNIFICVSSFNTGAIKLYLEYGFKQVGELPDFVKPGLTELLLRKTHGPLVGYVPKSTNEGT